MTEPPTCGGALHAKRTALCTPIKFTTMKKKILVIDDEREIADSVRIALEASGYDVVVCHNGNQGLAAYEKEKPDMVILDMMMPGRSGFLVIEAIRQQDDGYPIPIIMMTANDGDRHKAYAKQMGVDDYIMKPFPIDVMLAAVKRLLPSKAEKA